MFARPLDYSEKVEVLCYIYIVIYRITYLCAEIADFLVLLITIEHSTSYHCHSF